MIFPIPLTWKIAGGAALASLAIAGAAVLYARHEHRRAERAETRAEAAEQQATYEQAAGRIEARRGSNTLRITQEAHEARDAVQSAPDIDAAVTDYLAGLDRLRDAGKASVRDPDDG